VTDRHAHASDGPDGIAPHGEFCLFVESLDDVGEAPARALLPVLTVPPSGAVALAPAHDPPGWQLASAPAEAPSPLRLEAVSIDGRPALLLATPPGARVGHNGVPAGIVDVLAIADQIQIEGTIFHVSFMRRPRVGPPPEALVGVPCPVCALPVEAGSVVVVHECGAPLHLVPASADEPEPLECALLGCPACEGPVALEPGYAFLPEL